MKVALILSANIKYSPYVKYYVDYFEKNNIEYDIITWNRTSIDEANSHSYNVKHIDKNNKFNKVLKYIKYCGYKNYIIRQLKKYKYDKVVVFTIQVAYLINKFLIKRYKSLYIFDIRDFSLLVKQKNKIINELLTNSYANIVSSMGFKEFLPCNITICHNVDTQKIVNNIKIIAKPTNEGKKKISSIGSFLEFEQNKKILLKSNANNILEFYYIGQDTPEKIQLQDFANRNNINNVFFYGAYDNKNVKEIYNNFCDFVNVIRTDNDINRHAIPNKFYDGLIFGKPIITNEANVTISKIIKEFKLGIVLSDNFTKEELLEKIFDFDYELFNENRKKFLEIVIVEQQQFNQKLKSFLYDYE